MRKVPSACQPPVNSSRESSVIDAAITARWLARFDPSLAATHAELGLARVNWENCARAGHWDRRHR